MNRLSQALHDVHVPHPHVPHLGRRTHRQSGGPVKDAAETQLPNHVCSVAKDKKIVHHRSPRGVVLCLRQELPGKSRRSLLSHHGAAEVKQILVVHVLEALAVPKVDLLSESDPVVRLSLIDENGKRKSDTMSTLARSDCKDPVFDAYLVLRPYKGQLIMPTDKIQVEVYDVDYPWDFAPDQLIGTCEVSTEALDSAESRPFLVHRAKLDKKDHEDCFVKLRRQPTTRTSNYTKHLFLIRHGESRWNKGKDDLSLQNTLMQIDHPLTDKGVGQASSLNQAWRQHAGAEGGERLASLKGDDCVSESLMEQRFMEAGLVLVSPLCRAFQTAIVALSGHPTVRESGMKLLRTIREIKKSRAGVDCKADKLGEDISARVRAELAKIVGEEQVNAMMPDELMAKLNYNDTRSKWWTEKGMDHEDANRRRVLDFLMQVCFMDAKSAIVVGHSNFFFDLVSRCLDPEWRDDPNNPLAKKLTEHKLANCACLGIELTFNNKDLEAPPRITDAQLLFGTGLQTDKKVKGKGPRNEHAISDDDEDHDD